MNKYAHSIVALFICMLLMAPSTVYAEDLTKMSAFSVVQPISGAALSSDNLPDSLTQRLNYYLTDNFTNGSIDAQKYNEILSSGIVSENAFFANSVFLYFK